MYTYPSDTTYQYLTKIDALKQQGYTGKKVNVAVIDTGVDASHPGLRGKIAGGTTCVGVFCFLCYKKCSFYHNRLIKKQTFLVCFFIYLNLI